LSTPGRVFEAGVLLLAMGIAFLLTTLYN